MLLSLFYEKYSRLLLDVKKLWERRVIFCVYEISCGYFFDENVEDEVVMVVGEGGRGRERGRRRRKKRRGRV